MRVSKHKKRKTEREKKTETGTTAYLQQLTWVAQKLPLARHQMMSLEGPLPTYSLLALANENTSIKST